MSLFYKKRFIHIVYLYAIYYLTTGLPTKRGEYYKDYSKDCMLSTKYTYFKINFPNI